ncbi:MAG: SGNH/GDSL hydrolase family protein [Candidatus Microsaccharimonas sp.]
MGILDAPSLPPKNFAGQRLDAIDTAPSWLALQPWQTALANRDRVLTTILILSDSTAEGLGASITTTQARWIDRLRDALRVLYPTANVVTGGSSDYIPAYYDTSNAIATNGPVYSAGVTKTTSWGLGRRGLILPSSNTTDTITFTLINCTRFKVGAAKNSNSVMGISVDGGTVQSINLTQTNAGGFVAFDSGTLNRGTHTVVISRINGGTVTVEGIWRYDSDDTFGVRVLDGTHSGQATTHFGGSTAWAASAGVEPPDLVIDCLGYNDYLNATATPANTKVMRVNYRTAVRTAVTGKTPSWLYVALPEPKQGSTTPIASWQSYVTAQREVAIEDPLHLSSFLDLSTRVPVALTNPFGLYQADYVHPSLKGHAWIADQIFRYITS